jgi:transcriptional regulator with XRE-family HTH domain
MKVADRVAIIKLSEKMMQDVTNLLPKRLIELRKRKKLTQLEIAKKLGIARTTYSGYENGSREPDLKILQKVATFYDVSLDYLIGLTDETNPKKATEMTQAEMEKWINHPHIHPTWKGRQLSADELITLKRVLKALFEKEDSDADHLG